MPEELATTMSMQLYVFLPTAHLDTTVWQAGLDRVGAAVQLDPATDPASHPGFTPMVLRGQEAGAEMRFEDVQELTAGLENAAARIKDRPVVLAFDYGSALEGASAHAAAAGLIAAFDGLGWDPQWDLWFPTPEAALKVVDDLLT